LLAASPPPVGDVGSPTHSRTLVAVAHRHPAHLEVARAAVPVTQPALDIEDAARLDRRVPRLAHPVAVRGVHRAEPAVPADILLALPRERAPRKEVRGGAAVRIRRPDDLRARETERAVALLALPQRLLDGLPRVQVVAEVAVRLGQFLRAPGEELLAAGHVPEADDHAGREEEPSPEDPLRNPPRPLRLEPGRGDACDRHGVAAELHGLRQLERARCIGLAGSGSDTQLEAVGRAADLRKRREVEPREHEARPLAAGNGCALLVDRPDEDDVARATLLPRQRVPRQRRRVARSPRLVEDRPQGRLRAEVEPERFLVVEGGVDVGDGIVLLPVGDVREDPVRAAFADGVADHPVALHVVLVCGTIPLGDARDPRHAQEAAAMGGTHELREPVATEVGRRADEDRERLRLRELAIDHVLQLGDARGGLLVELGLGEPFLKGEHEQVAGDGEDQARGRQDCHREPVPGLGCLVA
jgi:hypothetical protein